MPVRSQRSADPRLVRPTGFPDPSIGVARKRHRVPPPLPIFRLGVVRYLAPMRTADEFNAYYTNHDPWGVSQATFRDRVLRARLTRAIRNKRVLELGCGEGHLTQAVFHRARSVMAVDISGVAIARAKSLILQNASF